MHSFIRIDKNTLLCPRENIREHDGFLSHQLNEIYLQYYHNYFEI